MRLLVTFIAICILALVVMAWHIVRSDNNMVTGQHDHLPAVSDTPLPAELPERDDDVTVTQSETPKDEALSGGDEEEPPEPTSTSAPITSPPTTHWAVDLRREKTLHRLTAAREVLAGDPYHPTALRDQLAALRELGRWSEAADTLALLIELEPDDVTLRLEQVEALLRAERWAGAIAPLRELVDQVPQNTQAWTYLAAAQQSLGHLHDAWQSWSRVLELKPEDVEACAHRGEVLLALHDWEAAAADFERVRQFAPDDIAATLGLSRALVRLGREQEAQDNVLHLLERHPNHVPAMNCMAELAWLIYQADPVGSRAQLDATITWCRNSLDVDAHQPTTRALLEAALRKVGE